MASTYNADRFFMNQLENAQKLFDQGEDDVAEDECCKLVGNILCPRLIQVWAWQLRSMCVTDYWMARAYLEKGLAMFDREDMNETELQRYFKDHTYKMLDTLEAFWKTQWAARGEEAPTKQNFERDRNMGYDELGENDLIVKLQSRAQREEASRSESSSNTEIKSQSMSDSASSSGQDIVKDKTDELTEAVEGMDIDGGQRVWSSSPIVGPQTDAEPASLPPTPPPTSPHAASSTTSENVDMLDLAAATDLPDGTFSPPTPFSP